MAGKAGGSWKVAYADFVTAMMAFFMVMWITAQDQKIKEAIAHSFNAPYEGLKRLSPNLFHRETMGIIPSRQASAEPFSSMGRYELPSVVEVELLRQLNESLLKALKSNPALEGGNSVKLELTGQGLNITVFNRPKKAIFEQDSPRFTEYGQWVLSVLAWEIARYKIFSVEVDGHTLPLAQPPEQDRDKWDLSTDRANAARRVLVGHGVQSAQLARVTGFADTVPLPDTSTDSDANDRVTILLAVKPQLPPGGTVVQ
jgi:chemotaxis protein MotB